MSFEIVSSNAADVENVDDGEHPMLPIAGFFDWLPGAKTVKAAWNSTTGNHVANAVKFTNENVTTGGVVGSAFGGGLFGAIRSSPIAMSSFVKIAEDDDLWKQYCNELSKTNTFVTCGYFAGPALRRQILANKDLIVVPDGPRPAPEREQIRG